MSKEIKAVTKKTHCTLLVGWNKEGNAEWIRSYDYDSQAKTAQADLKRVINSGLSFQIGLADRFLVKHKHEYALECLKFLLDNGMIETRHLDSWEDRVIKPQNIFEGKAWIENDKGEPIQFDEDDFN